MDCHRLPSLTNRRPQVPCPIDSAIRFGNMHAMKGPYSTERSVALMIARELLNEIAKRDASYNVG